MSHFSEIQTNLKNKTALQAALKRMGFEIEESASGVDVRGFFGDSVKADFKVLTRTHYDIGFKLNAQGSYEVIGDWELLPNVSGIEEEAFTQDLKREYAREVIVQLAQEKGYEIAVTENEESKDIELVVSQW
ncbi:MAG: DUF1257 domain-containing protein [Bdellovibrionaceae bacterium]|nr:DUF1257 domain-containing protein [Bdellovibrionales bacterium]MCB9255378.1 DUF1257 domain-containing protein [Pseudobdellovibrionaceae bacterium]